MSLLDMLKSLLGLGSSRERRSGQPDVGVTVEHEPGDVAPETATEEAVKGTDLSAGTQTRRSSERERASGREVGRESEPAVESGDGSVDIPDAEELSSGSGAGGEQDGSVEIPDAEKIEGVDGAEAESAGAEPDAAEVDSETTGAEPETTGPDLDPETANESTDVIKGIGDTYAERLAEAGIETVGDLAAADPATVAEESDVSESRLERWVERARNR